MYVLIVFPLSLFIRRKYKWIRNGICIFIIEIDKKKKGDNEQFM